MPRYVIERHVPGAGRMSCAELQRIAEKCCDVLRELGPDIQWIESYITDDKIYCIYRAPNEDVIRQHAIRGGFPADLIAEVKTVIDPTTAERVLAEI